MQVAADAMLDDAANAVASPPTITRSSAIAQGPRDELSVEILSTSADCIREITF